MSLQPELFQEVLSNLHEGIYFIDDDRKIVFWNSAAERVTGYPLPEVMGKQCRNTLFRHTNHKGTCLCRDACPMERSFKDLRPREMDVYIHRKDGSRMLSRVQFSPIKDSGGRTLVAVKFIPANGSTPPHLRQYGERIAKHFYQENLPGVADQQGLNSRLEANLDKLRRYGWQFGLLLLSLDQYESLIRQYGYPYWHKAARLVAETVKGSLRVSDTIGRWSENEFGIIALNVGPRELTTIAERLRVLVAQSRLTFYKEQVSLSCSVGAVAAVSEDTAATIVDRCSLLLRKGLTADGNVASI